MLAYRVVLFVPFWWHLYMNLYWWHLFDSPFGENLEKSLIGGTTYWL